MNIHPIFVHFPIALFSLYSLLEIFAYAWPSIKRQSWLFSVQAFLLIAGGLSAFAALITGDMAEDLIQNVSPRAFILEVHAPFAGVTTLVYIILAAAYIVRLFDMKGWGNRIVGENKFLIKILNLKRYLTHLVLDTWVLPVLALAGLVLIMITGSLGAAIVYGPNIDPIVSFVYHLFWAN